jgi:hypothetical protein
MYGFHSDKGMDMIKRLPKSKSPPTDVRRPRRLSTRGAIGLWVG